MTALPAAGTRPTRPTRREELSVASTGGALLHVEVHGPAGAPTAVLAHGWTCNTTFWDEVRDDLLAAGLRVVLYDQRGHGRSRHTPRNTGTEELADDLCAVLEATTADGERVVAGGHSMGGMTIVAAADREVFQRRVAAVMLCSTGMGRLTSEARVAPLRSVRARQRLQKRLLGSALPLGPVTPVSERALAYGTLGSNAAAELRSRVARMVHACPRRTRAEWGRVLDRLALTDRLPLLTVPAVVVHGTADRLTPPVHAHRMVAALPAAEAPVMLDGLGHMTPMEAPARISAVLLGLARDHLGDANPATGATPESPTPSEGPTPSESPEQSERPAPDAAPDAAAPENPPGGRPPRARADAPARNRRKKNAPPGDTAQRGEVA